MRALGLSLLLFTTLAAAEPPPPPWPSIIGDGVDPSARAHWPVRVRRLEKIEWRFSAGSEIGMAVPGSDGLLRIMAGGAGLRGVDAATGKHLWTRGGHARFWNYSSCVLGPAGTAYGGNHTWLSAVAADGTLRWRTPLQASWIHAPPALSPDGKIVYVGGDNLGIAALDARTGEVYWMRRDFGSPWTVYCFDAMGRLVAGFRKRTVCFDERGKELWTRPGHLSSILATGGWLVISHGKTLEAIGADDREVRWTLGLGRTVRGTALGDDGRLVVTLTGGEMAQVTLDGRVRWRRKVSDVKLGRPVTTRGGEILVMDTNGVLRLLDSNGILVDDIETGASFWRWRPSVGPDGRVYVNHNHTVLCIGGEERPEPKPVVATSMLVVADDFVVDVRVNGKVVPLGNRHLLAETFGATTERVDVDLREGDWVVFHAVANRLRWGGASYLGVHASDGDGGVAFVSTTKGGWFACDEPGDVPRFVAERGFGLDRPAIAPARPWHDAGKRWQEQLGGAFTGEPVWGRSASTWIKFVVPERGR